MLLRFKPFFPFAVTITLISGLIYLGVQQSFRLNANDPQIQLAQDVVRNLESGVDPKQMLPPIKNDLATTLAPFLLIYGEDNKLITSSVQLDGADPQVPNGVLDYAKKNGQDRVTWQPKPGVRSAIVVSKYGGEKPGVVIVGRSLKETEKRIDMVMKQIVLGWAVTMASVFVAVTISSEPKKKKK